MLYQLSPADKPLLQRQLDADQRSWARGLQMETEGEFNEQERTQFRMNGLFDDIPGNDPQPLSMPARP
jgi:hypothetical protein